MSHHILVNCADLRNGYNDISRFCHEYGEPVYITKNSKGDLAVMSIEAYEQLIGRLKLYDLIQERLNDIANGDTRPFSEAIADIRARLDIYSAKRNLIRLEISRF